MFSNIFPYRRVPPITRLALALHAAAGIIALLAPAAYAGTAPPVGRQVTVEMLPSQSKLGSKQAQSRGAKATADADKVPFYYSFLTDAPSDYRLAAARAVSKYFEVARASRDGGEDRLPVTVSPSRLQGRKVSLFRSRGALFLACDGRVIMLQAGPFPTQDYEPVFNQDTDTIVDAIMNPERDHIMFLSVGDRNRNDNPYRMRVIRLSDGKIVDFRCRLFGINMDHEDRLKLGWTLPDRISLTNGRQTAWFGLSGSKLTVTSSAAKEATASTAVKQPKAELKNK